MRKLCECGCGQPAPIATLTNRKWGHIKGEPVRFVNGHQAKRWKKPRFEICACGCRRELTERGKLRGCRFLHGHNRGARNGRWNGGRKRGIRGYVLVSAPDHPHADSQGYVREHILVATSVLGKPLPPGAVVHHVVPDRADNSNRNLVICQDQAYHLLLEQRTRALRECGHASWLKCRYCKRYDRPGNLRFRRDSNSGVHASCEREYQRRRREGRRT